MGIAENRTYIPFYRPLKVCISRSCRLHELFLLKMIALSLLGAHLEIPTGEFWGSVVDF